MILLLFIIIFFLLMIGYVFGGAWPFVFLTVMVVTLSSYMGFLAWKDSKKGTLPAAEEAEKETVEALESRIKDEEGM